MAEPFATVDDIIPAPPADRLEEAQDKLDEASIEIRANYPSIDRRIANGDLDPDAAKVVTVRMVKRALEIKTLPGVDSATGQTGPFMSTLRFTSPDGAVYLSKADKRMLAPKKKAFSIYPGGIGKR